MRFGWHDTTQSSITASKTLLGPGIDRVFVGGALSVSSLSQVQLANKLKHVTDPVVAAKLTPFVSFKPNPVEVKAGKWDQHFETAARSLPTGCYLTVWHEPENDMPAATFVAVYERAYARMKAANPTLRMGPVNMAYQWQPNRSATAQPWAWATTAKDFHGIDIYTSVSSGATLSIPQKSSWPRWTPVAGPASGWLVVERGIHQTVSQATVLDKDISYLRAVGAHGLMYWNSGGATDSSNYLLNNQALAVWRVANP